MTRPTLVRADSIDLQEQSSPSSSSTTKDHRPAPHHAEALREVRAEAAEENSRSPRVSKEWTVGETANLQRQIANHDALAGLNSSLDEHLKQQQDELAIAQREGITGSAAEDGGMADAEADEVMDDDMMDKISSSPSIDDGGYSLRPPLAVLDRMAQPAHGEQAAYSLPALVERDERHHERKSWPPRSDSLQSPNSPFSSSSTGGRSSSPFIDSPAHYPLHFPRAQSSLQSAHHLLLSGLYPEASQVTEDSYYDESQLPGDGGAQEDGRGEVSLESFEEAQVQTGIKVESYDDCFELTEDVANQLEQDIQNEPFDNSCPNTHQGILIVYESDEKEEEEDDDDDDEEDFHISCDEDSSRFIDSGWGGECLQDLEDIDFEFVYALHTFVATVEGQANAQKGDTMVLLDDSNSYWWLVRVVKDGSIGYLPAEHIETPTERLARLNKHRNIDLSATMLGDQADKPKNSLKKAIRRRNAKAVTFALENAYVEASDIEYSSEEEDGDPFYSQDDQGAKTQERGQELDESVVVEPLRTRDIKEVKTDAAESNGRGGEKTSSDMLDNLSDGPKSRNGTVRNTDSFFKDDSVETRKITITPALFRDDSTEQTSNESKDLKQRTSLEKLEKDSSTEKNKDDRRKKDKKDKKEKEKKPGMLSGLFKRGKDKKGKGAEDDVDVDELIMGKRSTENARVSPDPGKESQDSTREEPSSQAQAAAQQGQRAATGKLQKQSRTDGGSPTKQTLPTVTEERRVTEVKQAPGPERPPPATSVQDPSMRLVQPEDDPTPEKRAERQLVSPVISPPASPVRESKAGAAVSKIKSAIASTSEPRPEKVKKAKSRQVLDDFDSSSEPVSPVQEIQRALHTAPGTTPSTSEGPTRQAPQRPIPGAFPDSYMSQAPAKELPSVMEQEGLSESPVQVSPMEAYRSNPPPLVGDTSSQDEIPSPVSSPSPDTGRRGDRTVVKKGTQDSTSSSSTATWNDNRLRSFFDDDGEIKDLLTVVYDNSGVVPAGPDHPITGKLFSAESAKLADITNRLDHMLGDWLTRKMGGNQGGGQR